MGSEAETMEPETIEEPETTETEKETLTSAQEQAIMDFLVWYGSTPAASQELLDEYKKQL